MNEYTRFPNPSTPIGSARYYSIRFSAAMHRPALAQLLAWREVMISIRDRCSDPGVAVRKLEWWQKDLAAALAGSGQHPLTQALAETIRRRNLPLQPFEDLSRAVASELPEPRCASTTRLVEIALGHTGSLTELSYRACGGDQEQRAEIARRLGGYVRLSELIQGLGQDLRRGRCPVPEDLLQRHGLPRRLPSDATDAARWQPALAELAASCDTLYQETLETLADTTDPALQPALRWAAIGSATLGAIADCGFDLFDQRISLPALRKFWIAWRR